MFTLSVAAISTYPLNKWKKRANLCSTLKVKAGISFSGPRWTIRDMVTQSAVLWTATYVWQERGKDPIKLNLLAKFTAHSRTSGLKCQDWTRVAIIMPAANSIKSGSTCSLAFHTKPNATFRVSSDSTSKMHSTIWELIGKKLNWSINRGRRLRRDRVWVWHNMTATQSWLWAVLAENTSVIPFRWIRWIRPGNWLKVRCLKIRSPFKCPRFATDRKNSCTRLIGWPIKCSNMKIRSGRWAASWSRNEKKACKLHEI